MPKNANDSCKLVLLDAWGMDEHKRWKGVLYEQNTIHERLRTGEHLRAHVQKLQSGLVNREAIEAVSAFLENLPSGRGRRLS